VKLAIFDGLVEPVTSGCNLGRALILPYKNKTANLNFIIGSSIEACAIAFGFFCFSERKGCFLSKNLVVYYQNMV